MTPFDLLFIVVFLGTVTELIAAAVSALRGRRVRRTLTGLALFLIAYLSVVAVVAVASPQRVIAIDEPQCFDDWCIAVERVERSDTGASSTYAVTFRLFSRARGGPQRENGARVYLLDDRGRRYDPAPDRDDVPLNVLLKPGESVTTTRTFTVPSEARGVSLVVAHGAFPGIFIIGDGQSLFHKPAVVRLR